MELVTGRKGTPHVTSQQDRMLHQGIFGADSYILNVGEKLRTEIQSNNQVKIYDGAIVTQGALSVVKVNTYDTVQIANGNQGMKRHDLICLQYTYDSGQDTEKTEWVVVKGTPSASPSDPSHTSGDIQNSDRLVQFPVFRVKLDGINITGIDNILKVIQNADDVADYIVERGKTEHGFYEKWNSGNMKEWFYIETKELAINQKYSSSPLYFGNFSVKLHKGFKKVIHAECGICKWGTSGSWGAVSSMSNESIGIFAYDYFSRNAGEQSYISGSCVGIWK